jgi:endo-1,4-beta-xylanase
MKRTGAAIALVLTSQLACGGSKSPTAPSPTPTPTPVPTTPVDPLRDSASAAGKLAGTAVQSSFLNDPRYTEVFDRHFNYVTAEYEMKWDPIERVRGSEDFLGGDAIASYAAAMGMKLKGHALVWHGAVPGWANGLSNDDFRAAVERHIRIVADHYRGQVYAWDVVNEAIADDGPGLRDSVFQQKLGDTYIADAFRLARQSDPQALLFYNDYGGEGLNAKSDRIYDLVRGLVQQGVPIDGVGLQMHVSASNPPDASAVGANMRRLVSLGLRVNISEMDVQVRDLAPATRLDVQKSVYHAIIAACVLEARCDAVTFWGFTDAHSWLNSPLGSDAPLLFDTLYAPKPAFYGVQDAFSHR